jgi:Immunity protein 74
LAIGERENGPTEADCEWVVKKMTPVVNEMLSKVWRFLIWLGIGRETKIDNSSQLIKIGRDEYKYLEGERSLVLQVDMLRGRNRLLYSSTIERWLPPHQDETISEEVRHRIATKIANFLTSQGYSVKVQ